MRWLWLLVFLGFILINFCVINYELFMVFVFITEGNKGIDNRKCVRYGSSIEYLFYVGRFYLVVGLYLIDKLFILEGKYIFWLY